MLAVKLKEVMMDKLDVKLVTGMKEVSLKISKVD